MILVMCCGSPCSISCLARSCRRNGELYSASIVARVIHHDMWAYSYGISTGLCGAT